MTRDPASARARFGIRFALLARRWRRALDRHLAEAGLTDATWVPLIHLDETGGGITQKQLAELVGVDGSSLVRVINILAREGLVERRRDASDGRARLISLTPAGRQRVARIRAELTAAEDDLLAGLSEAEMAAMLTHFDRIDRNMQALDDRRRRKETR